jgi:tetratricopeptide (TPR) repeat protein
MLVSRRPDTRFACVTTHLASLMAEQADLSFLGSRFERLPETIMTLSLNISPLTSRAAKFVGASLFAISAMSLVAPATIDVAYAQDEEAPAEGRQFSADAGEKVNEALTFLNADNPQGAVNTLNALLSSGKPLNPYEKSTIYQMMGQAYNEVGNTAQSLTSFQNAINAGGLLPNEVDGIKVVVAQLLIVNGQYREGALALEAYLREGGQEKPAYVELLVQAWVEAEDYRKALPWAEKWFNTANPKERKHFDLLNFLYNNLNMPGRQADIVKQMIQKWPEDRTLWDNWASMLGNGGREQDAFEVNKMLYLGGALTTEGDIKKVIQYYSYYEMPYQAAQILEREMRNGRIQRTPANLEELSTYYRTAREYSKAIPVLEEAAGSADSAALYAALGEAYYNEGDCGEAEEAFEKAIARGYDAGRSWMQVANCIYDSTQNAERLDCQMTQSQMDNAPITLIRAEAIEAFRKVPSGSRESRNARRWLKFVSEEREAVERRCEFERNVEKELCFSRIKLEYDNMAFSGGEFELDDEKCNIFKAQYDELYVRVTTE